MFPLLALACVTPEPVGFTSPMPDDAAGPPAPISLWVDPVVRGETTSFYVTGLQPGQTVHLAGSGRGAGAGPCVQTVCLGVRSPLRLGQARADADGRAVVQVNVPPGLAAAEATFQAVAWGPPSASEVRTVQVTNAGADAAALLQGAATVNPGAALPSALATWSRRAVPLAVDADGHTFLAAARVNEGKLLIGGHETFTLSDPAARTDDADVIVENALRWMLPQGGTVGVPSGNNALRAWLTARGYTVVTAGPTQLTNVGVWMADTYTDWSANDDQAIRTFLAEGGGVITGGHAWWWATSHDEPAADAYPGNHWLRDAGVLVTTNTTRQDPVSVTTAPGPFVNGGRALDALTRHLTANPSLSLVDQRAAAAAVATLASTVPLQWPDLRDRVDTFLTWHPAPVPTSANPVEPFAEPLDAAWIHLRAGLDRTLPAGQITAHPAAANFPGAVAAQAPRITATVTADLTHAGIDRRYSYANAGDAAWRSTGLYAAPGEVITVTSPQAVVGSGVKVRIGAHDDRLWGRDTWERAPEVTRSWPITATTTQAANAFGGLVYLEVPVGTSLGDHPFTITGAVAAARFVAGVTSPQDWTAQRALTPPWGEVEADSFILTVPRAELVAVADPAPLAAFWQQVLDAQAELAAIPLDRPRAERVVTDRQISAGWMHSGYPFMAHNDSAAEFLSISTLTTAGSWGAFHELGHNHQWADWLLPGTTEATCNLWSVYTMETVVGLPPHAGHPALDAGERANRLSAYLAGGADFWGDWSVWVALETMLQLQEAFGWQLFIDLQALYLADPPASLNDQQKIDRFVLRTAQTANVDLGPFYVAWGFPVSPATLAAIDGLPDWAGDPMNP